MSERVPDFFTKDHEWLSLAPDRNTGVMGITAYAAHELGDVVYVTMPSRVGVHVEQFGMIAEVESVKAVSPIYSPVSGSVLEVNEKLSDSPEWINEDPFGKAWMIKLTIEKPEELGNLMDAPTYTEYLKGL